MSGSKRECTKGEGKGTWLERICCVTYAGMAVKRTSRRDVQRAAPLLCVTKKGPDIEGNR